MNLFGQWLEQPAGLFWAQGGTTTENLAGSAIAGFTGAVTVLVILGILILIIKSFLYIAPPSEVLIFSGLKRKGPDGTVRSFRLVTGGRGFRIPFFEKVDRMNLGLMEIPISIRGAYSKGGIALNVDAIANIKISSNLSVLPNAIERFLGRDVNEIRRVAKETLEGHVRGVLANLTPEEVNEDRLAFGEALSNECEEDLRKLGLHVDTVKIQHVTDDVHYLDSTGRSAIASVVREAEIAESNFRRAAEQTEAEQNGLAEVAKANAEATISEMKNEIRKLLADLDSNVKSEEERTIAAAREARAVAEQELQKIRAELAVVQQMADVILPAEAQQTADSYKAKGDAAFLRERGKAVGQALDILQQAWRESGDTAVQIAIIEEIEKILGAAIKGVNKIKVNNIQVIDNGSGKALSGYLSNYPEMLHTVFDSVRSTTGIDILGSLAGNRSNGAAVNPAEATSPTTTSTEAK